MQVAPTRAHGAHDASAAFADAEDARRLSDASDAADPMASFNQEVLEEAGSDYEPAYEEIVEYARWLGVKPHETRDFLWIAKEGLRASLPENWKPCRTGDGQVYYFNFATGESDWDHPCDAVFRAKVVEEREKRQSAKGPRGGSEADTSAEASDGHGSSFHSAAGGESKHSTMILDDFASDVSGDASKTFDRSFASPRPPAGKGTPSPRPVGPVARGFARTPLGRVDGNAARDGAHAAKRAGARTPASAGAHKSSSRNRAPATNGGNDENVLDLSILSQRSNVSNVSRGSRGRLASLPSLGKDPLAKKPLLGDGLRKKPLGARSARPEAPDALETKTATAEGVSDVSSRSFPSLVLDDDLDFEELGDVAVSVPLDGTFGGAHACEIRDEDERKSEAETSGTTRSSPLRLDAVGDGRSLRDAKRLPKEKETVVAQTQTSETFETSESSASLRAALERAQEETRAAVRAREEAEKAREEAKAALADADARARVAAEKKTAETFAAERSTLQANVATWETRAREAEDRLREALRVSPCATTEGASVAASVEARVEEATRALAAMVESGFAEQRRFLSSDRRALESAAAAAAEAARKLMTASSRVDVFVASLGASEPSREDRTFSRENRKRSVSSPRPPRSPEPRSHASSFSSLTDISASSADEEKEQRRPASPRDASPSRGSLAGRVRIRGRNLKPQPPGGSAGSSPATSPRHASRSVSPSLQKTRVETQKSYAAEANPACVAAAAAAETCARLVARLERLRAAEAAARKRGWRAGDDETSNARRRETEAWLARERASLGSFRKVAALLAS